MKAIKMSDIGWILNLMNQPSVRKASFKTHKIGVEENRRYWKNALRRKDFQAYAIGKIGLVRIDKGHIGIAIDEKHRKKGIAYRALKHLVNKGCVATIKPYNKASIRLFEKVGFVERKRFMRYG